MAGGRLAAILDLIIQNSLTAVSVSVKTETVSESVVSNSDWDGVLCDLVSDLSGSLHNRLDHGGVGHSMSCGETNERSVETQELGISLSLAIAKSVKSESIGSMGSHNRRMGNYGNTGGGGVMDQRCWGSQDFCVSVDNSGVPLDNSVRKTIAKSVKSESIGSMRGHNRGMGYNGNTGGGGVVDERGGGSQDLGVSVDDGGIPLDNSMRKTVAETVKSDAIGGNRVGNRDNRTDRGVVDERSGRGQHLGVSAENGSISLPLAIVQAVSETVVSESVVSNSDRDGVLCNLVCDLSRSLHNRLDHGMMSYSVSCGETNEGSVNSKELGISLGLGGNYGRHSREKH